MRHAISWSDLRGSSAGVWGLGTEGRANLRKLRSLGVEPVIVDDAPSVGDERVLATGSGGAEALAVCDVVVKTPGISRYRPEVRSLEQAGVPVVGGIGLWLQEVDRTKVVCITGTKGKSTTTSLLAHLAEGLGVRVVAGGNLGVPPYDPDLETDDAELFVIETSSYQATDVAVSPPVVAVTSLHPDHLPWHGDADTYFRDKLSLCSQPGAALTVAAGTSQRLRERSSLLGPEVRWILPDTYDAGWTAPFGLLGDHSLVNAFIARACLEAMGVAGATDDGALLAAAHDFGGLESRLQHVGTVAGVDFVDDSLSTNVLPTLAAVASFPGRRIALIAGGLDRDIDYDELAQGLAAREAPTLVLTVYTTGPRIARAIANAGAPQVEALPCAELPTAVRIGWEWARPDGTVLLSPAAASFDAFRDYRHRAHVFREAMASLREVGPG